MSKFINDSCNAKDYNRELRHNSISLMVFFDEAVYFRDDMINFNICRKEVRNFIQKFSLMGKYPKPDIPLKSKILKKFSIIENTLLTTQFMLSENDTINYSYAWNISYISRFIYI